MLNTNFLGCGLADRGSRVRFPAGAGNFSLHHRVQNGSGAHPASYPLGTTMGFYTGLKRPGREADHSPVSDAEVKNACSYTRVYPKVSGLAAWSENCKWYSFLPLGAIVSLFCESV
jgi:hypothetical protein